MRETRGIAVVWLLMPRKDLFFYRRARRGGQTLNAREINERTGRVVDSAMTVHSALGPGLLESAYEVCLAHELRKQGLRVMSQVALPVVYDGVRIEAGYRIDLLVDDVVLVELKAVAKLLPIHEAQLLSYLKLSGRQVGLLINFHVPRLKEGIRRLVNNLPAR